MISVDGLLLNEQRIHEFDPSKNGKTVFSDRILPLLYPSPSTKSQTVPKASTTSASGSRQFTCSHKGCKKVYTSIGNLNKHAAIHRNNAQPFECTLCGKEFRKKDGLQKHQLTHLDADAKPSFKCETCHKTLASRQMLELHTKTIHMGERPFKCSKCDKAFTRKCRLRDHLNTHKTTLNAHMPYSCKLCVFRASSLDTMQKHKRKMHP